MNRRALLVLETLRRRLEVVLFERRSKEYTGTAGVETLNKIRALEAQLITLRALLPKEDVILQQPERYGPMLERTLRELEAIHTAVKNYNWSRR